jgi:hypothetical protein
MTTSSYIQDTIDYEADKHQDILDLMIRDDEYEESDYPEYDDSTSF